MKKKIALLPGDGIGPEVVTSAVAVLKETAAQFRHEFEFETALIGGIAIDEKTIRSQQKRLMYARALMRFY